MVHACPAITVWVGGQDMGAAGVRETVGCVGWGSFPLACPGRPQGETTCVRKFLHLGGTLVVVL